MHSMPSNDKLDFNFVNKRHLTLLYAGRVTIKFIISG